MPFFWGEKIRDMAANLAAVDQVVDACVRGGMKMQYALIKYKVNVGNSKSPEYRRLKLKIKRAKEKLDEQKGKYR